MMKPTHSPTDASLLNDAWRERAEKGLDDAGRSLLAAAVRWGQDGLPGHDAGTGEPLGVHAAGVVLILAEIGADAQARAAAILTMLPAEAKAADIDRMRKEFG